MKCPKCGYLGFETSERCRNCGYDFSLTSERGPASELPLHSAESPGEPLADFDLSVRSEFASVDDAAALDLERLIGSDDAGATNSPDARNAAAATSASRPPTAPRARSGRSAPGTASAPSRPITPDSLPLFTDDETPLITSPRPLRPPLSVRRTTPEIPRTRARRLTPRPDDASAPVPRNDAEEEFREPEVGSTGSAAPELPAAPGRRLTAALIDIALLGAINFVVVYLTLALSGLSPAQRDLLPVLPIATFFVILDGGYLVAFIAASGQTIGKMLMSIRVIRDDGRRVDIPSAVFRAAGCGLTLLTAGLGYVPALVTADRRALHDRLTGTRVISAP